jgi:hypothetical protein
MTFKKNFFLKTNLLKAPSRHKKFFHQISFEYFNLNVFFYFFEKAKILINNSILFFQKLNLIFEKIGSNTLTKTKFSTKFCIVYGGFFLLS